MCFGVRKAIRYGDVFVKEKESDFVLKLLISKWERKQVINKMDMENCKRFVGKKGIFLKEFYLW